MQKREENKRNIIPKRRTIPHPVKNVEESSDAKRVEDPKTSDPDLDDLIGASEALNIEELYQTPVNVEVEALINNIPCNITADSGTARSIKSSRVLRSTMREARMLYVPSKDLELLKEPFVNQLMLHWEK